MEKRKETDIHISMVSGIGMFLLFLGILMLPAGVKAEERVEHYLTPYQTNRAGEIYVGNPEKSFSMMGENYFWGFTLDTVWSSEQAEAAFSLEQGTDKVSFAVGHIDGAYWRTCNLKVYLDQELVETIALTGDMATQTFTLSAAGKKQLYFITDGNATDGVYAVANVMADGIHDYDVEMTKSVSVVDDGEYTYTCKQCGYSYTEIIPRQTYCIPYPSPYQSDFKCYEKTEDTTDYFQVMGDKYYKGMTGNGTAPYNLGRAYKTMTFTVGHTDRYNRGDMYDATLQVWCDSNLMKTIELTPFMMKETISVNTEGVNQLRLIVSRGNYAIFNMEGVKFESSLQAHTFEDQVLVEASLGKSGLIYHLCTVCGASYTEVVPVLTNGSQGGNGTGGTGGTGGSGSHSGSGNQAGSTGTGGNHSNAGVFTSKIYPSGNLQYRIISPVLKTAQVVGVRSSKATLKIPATVNISGVKYRVTSIKKNAFRADKKLKTLTIGSNVKTIGSKAFYKCKKLKKIKVKSSKLLKVGSKALKGVKKNIKIYVPKKRLSKYKRIFSGKGQKVVIK